MTPANYTLRVINGIVSASLPTIQMYQGGLDYKSIGSHERSERTAFIKSVRRTATLFNFLPQRNNSRGEKVLVVAA